MKRLALVICLLLTGTAAFAQQSTIDLAGRWRFRLDPKNQGIQSNWFNQKLEGTVRLPGSTDQNKKGERNTKDDGLNHLSRIWTYKGVAWYQKEVVIPKDWAGRRTALFLERCHWETRVWLDGRERGMRDSLCVPHVHEMGVGLKPGKHTITIRVDNNVKFDIGAWCHSITEETQTNWNGIVGRIELQSTPPVWIERVAAYPEAGKIRVKAFVANQTGKPFPAWLRLKMPFARLEKAVIVPKDNQTSYECTLPVPKGTAVWDEFAPKLHPLTATLVAGDSTDEASISVGLRDLRVKNKRIVLNGRNLFFRGTLECCIFPDTGYPPTGVESWLRIIRIAQSYGLNHLRFHSWCPPEAAFVAADQMGFYLQVELPQWVANVGQDPPRDEFVKEEAKRILDTYGNHPSFTMLCMGNELQGDQGYLQNLVKYCQAYDTRRLYTPATAWSHGAADDYRVVVVRGLHGPTTDKGFAEQIGAQPVPTISHEIGQWAIFPNLAETSKYTGVLRPRNFDHIRDSLVQHGMLDQAAMFTQASGMLSALLYKEEMEVLLRTRGHSGFQLLDLHDFPGQGTALVGILDAFWDSKGLVTPAEHRRYCAPIVPLVRLPKRTFTIGESLSAKAEVAWFTATDAKPTSAAWRLTTSSGSLVAQGVLPTRSYRTGDLHEVGDLSVPLTAVSAPAKLTLSLRVGNASNSWNIWVYPSALSPAPIKDFISTRSLAEAQKALEDGKKVLLFAGKNSLVKSLPGSFTPVFWSPVWFSGQGANTMGILCDPKHPALAGFPTDFYTDWQWYDLLQHSRTMNLDQTPKGFRPIVQVIDNFTRNQKFGNLFEAKVGKGKLVVCSIDLWTDLASRPAARQLYSSLLDYIASDEFEPKDRLSETDLASILQEERPPLMQALGAKVVQVDSEDKANGNLAANAIDGDPETIWHTQWEPNAPPCPHEIQIDLGKSLELNGIRILPRQDMANARIAGYRVYLSDDGATWANPVAEGALPDSGDLQTIGFNGKGRYLRFVATSGIQGQNFVAIAELEVVPASPWP